MGRGGEGTAVHDDARDRDTEALVERHGATVLHRLGEAVDETVELAIRALANVGTEAGAREVKGVDDEEGGGAGESARGHVDTEPRPELLLLVVLGEDALEEILEGEVESLGREVADDVREVAAPQCVDALLLRHSCEGVRDALVPRHLAGGDPRVGILGLDDQLDALCSPHRPVSRPHALQHSLRPSLGNGHNIQKTDISTAAARKRMLQDRAAPAEQAQNRMSVAERSSLPLPTCRAGISFLPRATQGPEWRHGTSRSATTRTGNRGHTRTPLPQHSAPLASECLCGACPRIYAGSGLDA